MRCLLASELLVCALSVCVGHHGFSQSNSTASTAQAAAQDGTAMMVSHAANSAPLAGAFRAMAAAPVAVAQANPGSPQTPTTETGFDPFGSSRPALNPLTEPTISPGVLLLLQLEARFADDVAANGGKAFASWFAEDAVTLSNGRPPVIGRTAIAAEAQWDPKQYQLTWVAQGARMGPSSDMGFTWGHYDSTAKDAHGETVKTSGRYMTIWKKMQDGSWKVELDSSAEEPPDPGTCCSLPKP